MEKNEIYNLNVISTSTNGDGVAKLGDLVIFIPGALEGEEICAKVLKIKKNIVYAKLVEVTKASASRVEPICATFSRCGGCSLCHVDYKTQLELKAKKVKDTIKKIGKIDMNIEEIVPSPQVSNYRNKALIPVYKNKENEIICGFFRNKSHDVIETKECEIQDKDAFLIAETIKEFMKKFEIEPYDEVTKQGLIRHIYFRKAVHTNEVMTGVVTNGTKLPFKESLVEMILEKHKNVVSIIQNVNKKDTNVIMGEKTNILYGQSFITDNILGHKFKIGVTSFYQVNPYQVENLYKLGIDSLELKKDETLFDIYCGIGTIGICAAANVKKVIGVEIVPEAIYYAKENAKQNNASNVEFYVGKAEEKILELIENNEKPDAVVLDPPRAGCDKKLIEAIATLNPKKICYISCDPATLARDLDIFCNTYNYKATSITPVDMFPMGMHVETCVLLSHKNS